MEYKSLGKTMIFQCKLIFYGDYPVIRARLVLRTKTKVSCIDQRFDIIGVSGHKNSVRASHHHWWSVHHHHHHHHRHHENHHHRWWSIHHHQRHLWMVESFGIWYVWVFLRNTFGESLAMLTVQSISWQESYKIYFMSDFCWNLIHFSFLKTHFVEENFSQAHGSIDLL